jgi:autotransporter-associated beta strand protein
VAVGSGATFNLGGNNPTLAGLTGSGIVTNSANALTLNVAAGNNTFAGSIRGAGALTKSGAGAVTLTGANTYSGATTVNGGALSLGTTGSLTATTAVTVNSGSTLLLGSSVANSINTDANLTLGGGQLSMGAAGTGGSRASSQTFNSLTLTANSSIDYANLTGLSSLYFSNISGLSTYTLSIFNYNGSNLSGGSSTTGGEGQFTKLYAATGGAFGANLGNILFFAGSDASSSFLGGGTFSGPSEGGFTQIVPVPEPSVVIAALMLLAWLLYTNRSAMRRLIGC